MPAELTDIWTNIAHELQRSVDDATYRHWLAPLEPVRLDGATLVITAPDAHRSWVVARFARLLRTCASTVLDTPATVEIVPAGAAGDPGAAARAHGPASPAEGTLFNPKYTFDQFVIGDDNRFAHAAALAVAEQPGQAYNPLFLYGPPGLGKTHLLHSIANYVSAHGDGLTVRYVTAETFTNDFIAALRHDDHDRFKAGYRTSDVLLVDDVQFLEGKPKIEEEFFHTFNVLYESGSQLVFSSDRTPRDIQRIEDRLRERFAAGLVASIEPPDLVTRLTILRKRAQHDGVQVAEPAALRRVAERIGDNVRALEAALVRVVAFHSLTGRAITEALVTEVLDSLYGPVAPGAGAASPRGAALGPRTVRQIQDAVCEAFGISHAALLSHDRARALSWARQVAMYLARELTDASLPQIGREFGGRHHATVLSAHRTAERRIAADPEAHRAVRELADRLRAAG